MERKKSWSAVALAAVAAVLAGCAANRVDLVRTEGVRVKILSAKGFSYVSDATVYREDQKVLVAGHVTSVLRSPVLMHVDVVVISPDGTPLAEAQSRAIHSIGRGTRTPFWVILPAAPPEGAVVSVALHGGPHRDSEG